MQASHIVLMIFSFSAVRLLDCDALAIIPHPSLLSLLELLPGAKEQIATHTMLKAKRNQALVEAVCAQVANFRPVLVGIELNSIIGAYTGT
jgi:hypothetical protein